MSVSLRGVQGAIRLRWPQAVAQEQRTGIRPLQGAPTVEAVRLQWNMCRGGLGSTPRVWSV